MMVENFFEKYAKKGDTIADITFAFDGEYHKKGIDIKIDTDVTSGRASGEGGHEMYNGRLVFTMSIINGKRRYRNYWT